jgi:hypothetical protein
MSLPGSAVTVELPRWPLADRATLALAAAAAVALELLVAREGVAVPGLAMLVAGGLVLHLWRLRRARPQALELGSADASLRFAGGPPVPCTLGRSTRVLGPTVVLHWRSTAGCGALWLTPADLPRPLLRMLTVRLVARARPVVP